MGLGVVPLHDIRTFLPSIRRQLFHLCWHRRSAAGLSHDESSHALPFTAAIVAAVSTRLSRTLSNLASLTPNSGDFQLDVNVADSGIADFAGNLLASADRTSWSMRPGDANLDERFDQRDIVQILQSGKYLTGEPAKWTEGDWNGDGEFDQLDIVTALLGGNYLRSSQNAMAGPARHRHRVSLSSTVGSLFVDRFFAKWTKDQLR